MTPWPVWDFVTDELPWKGVRSAAVLPKDRSPQGNGL